jgi:hypothetical protein
MHNSHGGCNNGVLESRKYQIIDTIQASEHHIRV